MSKKLGVVLSFAVFALSFSASAAAQQSIKIGIVDAQKAFEASAEGKKGNAQLQARKNKFDSDLAQMDKDIKQLQSKLTAQQLTLTEETRLQLGTEIQKKTTERKRYEEDASEALNQLQYSLGSKIKGEMMAIVEQIVKEKGLDLVLDLRASGVVYFSESLDITDEVVKRYDASKAAATKK
jgi:outer membrane protein